MELLPDSDSDTILNVLLALSFLPEIKERRSIQFAQEEYSVLHYPPSQENEAVFEVIAIFDPASEDAQKMVPIIQTLRKVINMNLKIFLSCQENLSELPVKSFYRFMINHEPVFGSGGPGVVFPNLPQHSLLSMKVRARQCFPMQSEFFFQNYVGAKFFMEPIEGLRDQLKI